MSEFQIRQEQIDVERKFRAMNNCGHESDLTRLLEERDRYRKALLFFQNSPLSSKWVSDKAKQALSNGERSETVTNEVSEK